MKELTLQSLTLAGPAAQAYSAANPSENQERLAYDLLTILQGLRTQNFAFSAPETTDFATFNSDMNTWLSDANDRFDDWLQGNIASAIGNVPDAITIGAAFVSGGAPAVGAIILEKVLNHMFHVAD